MKRFVWMAILTAGVAAYGQEPQRKAPPELAKTPPPATRRVSKPVKPAARAATAPAVEVPKDAKRVDASNWRAVDAQGKAWIYHETPFGVSKYAEQDVPKPVVETKNPVRATDLGDHYHFEQSMPFGKREWDRKKDALTDSDKEILKEQQPGAAAAKAN